MREPSKAAQESPLFSSVGHFVCPAAKNNESGTNRPAFVPTGHVRSGLTVLIIYHR